MTTPVGQSPTTEKENDNCTVPNAMDELPEGDENHGRPERREASLRSHTLPPSSPTPR